MSCQGENNKTNVAKCVFGLLKYFIGFKKKKKEMEIQAHYTFAPSRDTLQFVSKRRHSELKPSFSDFLLGGFCVFNQQRFTGHRAPDAELLH